MRVLLDARPHGAGCGRVARLLPRRLGAAAPDVELLAFGSRRRRHERPAFSGRLRHLLVGWWKRILEDQLLLPRLAARHRVDLFHATVPLVPHRMPVPTVAHCYDLTPLDPAARRPRGWMSRYERRCLERALRTATLLVVPSDSTRRRLLRELRLPAERVVRVYPPLPDLVPSPGPLLETVEEPFLLSVGTLEPRKNLVTLLAAHRLMWRRRRVPLVLVGAYGWGSREVVRAAARSGGAVRWLGWVGDSELALLYRRAAAVVQVSRDEGFSYPVAEALQAGAPLVVSDIPVHAELAAGLARRVGIDDRDGLADALLAVLAGVEPAGRRGDDEARRRRAARRVAELQAGGAAAAYLDLYGGAARSGLG